MTPFLPGLSLKGESMWYSTPTGQEAVFDSFLLVITTVSFSTVQGMMAEAA